VVLCKRHAKETQEVPGFTVTVADEHAVNVHRTM
jgi:hypothetical protein